MFKARFNRRGALAVGALPLLLTVPAARMAQAQDAAPAAAFAGRANQIRLGSFEVTTLLGGTGDMPDPIQTFGLNADPAEFEQVSAQNFIPNDRTGSGYTPTLVRTPEALVLFDAGDNAANIGASMAAVGVMPEDITHVVLTHMHGDHVRGLMADGAPAYPNAQLIVPRLENDYWAANPGDAYTANVVPLLDGARQTDDGEEIVPGITAEGAYGHTPGHTTYLLDSEGQKLLITGDSFSHYVYSVERPDWQVRFDIDKVKGAEARAKVLARLAEERLPFIGYHMPFPALGFIAPNGENSFRYVPATYQFTR
ncbi:MBL fold metallo-hydrolase [Paracoccus sp. S1E-3]|uniref:MBL fold metallo-hydrolase n=1 Tax=Paracoccus sp. S1E-3 TaxID=2756130 RepID=UPI0015EF74BA|nr:MBL fold metallo-hydrolase [Paracoccus sp. S1E-3]MBA4492372.1 MBL fold metallo-hydrolase [Paracoccus sp. S1E-3]